MHPILPACMFHSRTMPARVEVSGKPDQTRTSDLRPRHLFAEFITVNALLFVSLHMLGIEVGHNGKSAHLVKTVAVISKIGVKNTMLQAGRRIKTCDSMYS